LKTQPKPSAAEVADQTTTSAQALWKTMRKAVEAIDSLPRPVDVVKGRREWDGADEKVGRAIRYLTAIRDELAAAATASNKELPPITPPGVDEVKKEWEALSLPVEELPAMRSWLSEDAAKRFPGVIKAIDPQGLLPPYERAWIAQRLIGARCSFDVRTEAEAAALQPAQEIKRLRAMETAVATFFEALGIETIPSQDGDLPAPLGMLLPDVVDVTAIDGSTVLKNSRIMFRILWAVGKAAGRSADMAAYISPARDHGGERQAGPRAATELLFKLFWIYDGIRRRHPTSGPETAWSDNRGGIRDFTLACLKMIAPQLMAPNSKKAPNVRDAFARWRAEDARLRRGHPDLYALSPPREPGLA
jgi:hypothetical protein